MTYCKWTLMLSGNCTAYLVGGTLCGSQYGDVHVSGAKAKAVVTGSTFTSSAAALAYGNGGEIDLSGATGDSYTINVVGGMMTPEMKLDDVKLPDNFALFDDDSEEKINTSVPSGKTVTAKLESPAGGDNTDNSGGNAGDTGNAGNEGNTDNTGNEGNADGTANSDFPILAIIPAVLIFAAFIIFLIIIIKKKKEKETDKS